MSHLIDEQIDSANHKNIADYLINNGIRLKKISNQYLWEEQNVWIRENKWYSHYEQTGGLAVTFVMKYFDKTFPEAVAELNGDRFFYSECHTPKTNKPLPLFEMPPRNSSTYRVFMYLHNARGIDKDVIDFFVHNGTLYEDGEHHNCVFVGTNMNGRPCHVHIRSTLQMFKQTVAGSQAEYSFHYNGISDTIYVFEAPIDMLAFISMHKNSWKAHSYVALCSVSEKALMHQLEENDHVKHIVLCLDNDEAGQSAEDRITNSLLEKGYTNIERLIPQNKDWDEDLIKQKKEMIECQESKHLPSLEL